MRTGRVVSLLALVAGLGLLAWAAVQGDLSVHLFLVVPVMSGSGGPAALGMLLAMGGLLGWVLTGFQTVARAGGPEAPEARHDPAGEPDRPPTTDQSARTEDRRETRSGGIILLGPIPIAWGSDRESLLGVVVAAIVLMLVAVTALVYL